MGAELPTAGSGLVWARTSCQGTGEEEDICLPFGDPHIAWRDLQRLITHLRGGTSLFLPKSELPAVGDGSAFIPWEGMQSSVSFPERLQTSTHPHVTPPPLHALPQRSLTAGPRLFRSRSLQGILT